MPKYAIIRPETLTIGGVITHKEIDIVEMSYEELDERMDKQPSGEVIIELAALEHLVNKGSTVDPLSAEGLREAHGGIWGQHPSFPAADWGAEATNNDTRLGYWDWVEGTLANQLDDVDGLEFRDLPKEINEEHWSPEAFERIKYRLAHPEEED